MQARKRRAATAIAIVLALGASLGPGTAAAADEARTSQAVVPPAGALDAVDDPPPDSIEPTQPAASEPGPASTIAPPSTVSPPSTVAPSSTTAPETTATGTSPSSSAPRRLGAKVTGVGVGVAIKQAPASKWHEAAVSCNHDPPQTSKLLGIPGSASDRGHDWVTLVLVAITAAAGACVLIALLVRRHRASSSSRQTLFELVGGSVAIVGTLAGLATAFVPGVGVRERPAPHVTMVVREVHARIIRSVYQDAVGEPVSRSPGLTRAVLLNGKTGEAVQKRKPAGLAVARAHAPGIDGFEIGNVAWLELHFSGYGGRTLQLQRALFRPGAGASFIPQSDDEQPIEVDDGDESTQFVPIWFGAPRLPRFRAEFRVLDGGRVLQMARTESMRGLAYRYACPPAT